MATEPMASTQMSFRDAAIDFLGGVSGATASVYIGQPLDTVKVKMQTFPNMYTHAGNCFVTTLRQDGIWRGLYAGTVPSLVAQVAENSVLFCSYGMCQKVVARISGRSDVQNLNFVQNGASGFIAGFFCSLVLCPTELVKCKLQAMREVSTSGAAKSSAMTAKKHIGPLQLTRQILRTEGVNGLFHGLTATLCREMPGYVFFFGGYEACRSFMTPAGHNKDDLGPLKTILCGGIGGMSFWLAVFPADVIKSRHQVSSSRESFLATFLYIYRHEGLRALYKGLGPAVLRTFPATGGLFLAYETTKKILK